MGVLKNWEWQGKEKSLIKSWWKLELSWYSLWDCLGKWEKARSQLAEKFRKRVGPRLRREHPRRPRREKEDCLSNERSSRGTNQDDKPKIGKTGQKLTKQAQLSSVLWYCINSVQSGIKPSWVLSSPQSAFTNTPRHTPGKSQVRITETLLC